MIDSLTYTIGRLGIRAGVPMFECLLGETGFDYADVVLALRDSPMKGAKVVELRGAFTAENADEVYALIVALDDAGFITYVQTDGSVYFPWMARVKLNSVLVTGKWLPRRVQEFIWAAPGGIVLPPEVNSTPLFLALDPERTRKILKTSALNWRIYDPETIVLDEYLLGGSSGVA